MVVVGAVIAADILAIGAIVGMVSWMLGDFLYRADVSKWSPPRLVIKIILDLAWLAGTAVLIWHGRTILS
jgi:hypothetical protein